MAILMMLIFTLLRLVHLNSIPLMWLHILTSDRAVFLPIMLFTMPLPRQLAQHWPSRAVGVLQWFAFYAFAALLTLPWPVCLYQLVFHGVGRAKHLWEYMLNEDTAPKVVVVMPCYNEKAPILLRTVDSIVDCEYPPSCMHVFLSFDGDGISEAYVTLLKYLGVPPIQKFAENEQKRGLAQEGLSHQSRHHLPPFSRYGFSFSTWRQTPLPEDDVQAHQPGL
jgi:chitin synthase